MFLAKYMCIHEREGREWRRHLYFSLLYPECLAYLLGTVEKLKEALLTEGPNEWGGGVDRLASLYFLPLISPMYSFLIKPHNRALKTYLRDDETNNFSCVQDSSAQCYQRNHIPILEAKGGGERCDWSLDFLQATNLCCRLWWPRTTDPCQGETDEVWPELARYDALQMPRARRQARGGATASLEVKIFSFTQLPTCREGN